MLFAFFDFETVAFDDFLILSKMFGRHGEERMHRDGDFDENGRVDFADFLTLSQAFQGDS